VRQAQKGLAKSYFGEGRYAEAETIYRELGSGDLPELAALYEKQGRSAEAEALRARLVDPATDPGGLDHPLEGLRALARDQYQLGHYDDVEATEKRAIATAEKIFGADDTRIAPALSDLATFYELLGRYSDAEPIRERILALFERGVAQGVAIPSGALKEGRPASSLIGIAAALDRLAQLKEKQGLFDEPTQMRLGDKGALNVRFTLRFGLGIMGRRPKGRTFS
jgi:tetratricopeptide (TPR) repeat protein